MSGVRPRHFGRMLLDADGALVAANDAATALVINLRDADRFLHRLARDAAHAGGRAVNAQTFDAYGHITDWRAAEPLQGNVVAIAVDGGLPTNLPAMSLEGWPDALLAGATSLGIVDGGDQLASVLGDGPLPMNVLSLFDPTDQPDVLRALIAIDPERRVCGPLRLRGCLGGALVRIYVTDVVAAARALLLLQFERV